MRTSACLLLAAVLGAGLFGCGGDPTRSSDPPDASGPPDAPGGMEEIALQFRALIDGQPVACGETYRGLGRDGFALTVEDARMYVHDLELLREDGSAVPFRLVPDGKWQSENIALLDFEGGRDAGCSPHTTEGMHDTLRGEAPPGEYVGVRFVLGVPFDQNHQDQAVAAPPLDVSSMFWTWKIGYRFLRFEGTTETREPFVLHLGSSGCEGGDTVKEPVTGCKYPSRPTLSVRLDPTRQAVAIDFARLLADSQAGDSCVGAPEGKEREACLALFAHLGLSSEEADVFVAADRTETLARGQDEAPEVPVTVGGTDCHVAVPDAPYVWTGLPEGVSPPPVPADNPMSEAKVQLGRRLFFDPQLSLNGEQSCASCHDPSLAFTDGLPRGIGSTGEENRRSSMALGNIGYATTFTWANPLLRSLEEQAMVPLFGDMPIELGFSHREDLEARLRTDPVYPALFVEAFGDDCEPVSVDHVTKAIAAFERSLLTFGSDFDRYYYLGERDAMSADAIAGRVLFFDESGAGEKFRCHECHDQPDFRHKDEKFLNNGLYDEDGMGTYPAVDQGVFEITMQPTDMGTFKAPSLRNVALTAPYMHDGSLATLDEVIDHYANPANPVADTAVPGFEITADERRQLKAFLHALTDEAFVSDPRFQSPFPE